MSMSQMTQALKMRTGNPLRKLVLLKLADVSGDDGASWPSIPHIARECEMSERAVQMHIKYLVERDFLWIESRKSAEGLNRSNVYHLTLDKARQEQKVAKKRKKKAVDTSSGANDAPHGANDAPYKTGANDAPPTATDAPINGAGDAPRSSHSFDPVNDPKETPSDEKSPLPLDPVRYAFYGSVIRLTHDDYENWLNLYRNIDLRYELARLDIEFREEKPKNWFVTLSQKLNYQNKAAARPGNVPVASQPHWNDASEWENFM